MNYKNPIETDHNTIKCDLMHPILLEWFSYDCPPSIDADNFDNVALYTTMANDPNLVPYVAPIKSNGELAMEIRSKRYNIFIKTVDPIINNPFRWASLTALQQSNFTTYRQELLDITLQVTFPQSVIWPTPPI